MINFKYANRFCKDDIALIQNYEQATNDKTQTWDCHHRLEELGLSRDELKDRNLYYDRPASELIFLTHSDHMKLHKTRRIVAEETKKKASEANKRRWEDPDARQHQSERMKGENNPMYGKRGKDCHMYDKHPTWMNNGITRVRAMTQEEIEHYSELGYKFGMKLSTI